MVIDLRALEVDPQTSFRSFGTVNLSSRSLCWRKSFPSPTLPSSSSFYVPPSPFFSVPPHPIPFLPNPFCISFAHSCHFPTHALLLSSLFRSLPPPPPLAHPIPFPHQPDGAKGCTITQHTSHNVLPPPWRPAVPAVNQRYCLCR